MSVQALYLKAGISSVAAKFINIFAGIAILWLLNAILDKAEFGVFMVALTTVIMVGAITSAAFHSVVMYHVSRLQEEKISDWNRSKTYAGTAMFYGLVFSCLIALGMYLGADPIAHLFNKPDMAYWLRWLAVLIPLDMIRMVLAVWYQARQKIPVAVLFQEALPNILRVIGLGVVLCFAAHRDGVLYAYIFAFVLPVIVLWSMQPVWPALRTRIYRGWDYGYGLKVMLIRAINQPNKNIDILLVGALASAEVTAEYTLASRLAIFLLIGRQAVLPLLTARFGALRRKTADRAVLEREYHSTRFFALSVCLAGAVGFTLLGPHVLPLFGAYGNAIVPLLLLSGVMIVRVAAGPSGEYLYMAGHSGWTLASAALSVLSAIAAGLYFIPILGTAGGALSVLISMLLVHLFLFILIYRFDHYISIDLGTLNVAMLSICCLFAAGWGYIDMVTAALGLVFLLLLYLWLNRPYLGMILGQLKNKFAKTSS